MIERLIEFLSQYCAIIFSAPALLSSYTFVKEFVTGRFSLQTISLNPATYAVLM